MGPANKKAAGQNACVADGLSNRGSKREEFVKLWMRSADLAATYSPVP